MVGHYRCLAFYIGPCPMPMSHATMWRGVVVRVAWCPGAVMPMVAWRWHQPMSAGRGHVAMSPGMGPGAGLCRCRLGAWACRPAYARPCRLGAGHVAWPMRAIAWALGMSPGRWACRLADAREA